MTDTGLARADFLRNLPASDFCPPEGRPAALGLPVTPEARTRQADDTRRAVDEFATEYWSFPPAERRAEWKRLNTRPADAPTAAFLAHLKGGLAVGPAPDASDDPALAELGAMTRELFTLRPRPRSIRRAAWLDTREPSVNWSEAVGRLWATDSAAAELDPLLIGFLDDESPPPTSIEAGTPPRSTRAYQDDEEYTPRSRRRYREDSAPEQSSGWSPWVGRLGIGGVIVIIIIVIRIIVACAGGLSKTPSNSPSNTPSYSPSDTLPTYSYTQPTRFGGVAPNAGGQRVSFSSDQVSNFRLYESLRRGSPPPRYDDWVRAGKPSAGVSVPSPGSNRP